MGNKPVILPLNQNKFEVAEYASTTDYSTSNIHRKQFCVEHKLRTLLCVIPREYSAHKLTLYTVTQNLSQGPPTPASQSSLPKNSEPSAYIEFLNEEINVT